MWADRREKAAQRKAAVARAIAMTPKATGIRTARVWANVPAIDDEHALECGL